MAHGAAGAASRAAPSRLIARSLALLPAAAVFLVLWPLARPVQGSGDAFQFWYAGHLVASGGSPYDPMAWRRADEMFGALARNVAVNCADPLHAACVWLYPPLTAWLFAPFGLAAAPLGTLLVSAFAIVTAIAGVLVTVAVFGPRGAAGRALLLAAFVAAQPFVVDIRAGHFLGVLLLGVGLVAVGLRNERGSLLALGTVLLLLKAHLFTLLAPLVLAWLVRERAWRSVALTAAAAGAALALAFARSPDAAAALVSGSAAKTGIAWSTTWMLAGTLLPLAPAIPFAVLLALSAASAAAALRGATDGARADVIVACGCVLSLIVTPYAQPYDLLLLAPALSLAAREAERARAPARVGLLGAIVLTFAYGTWAVILIGDLHPLAARVDGVLPLVSLVLLAISLQGTLVGRAAVLRKGIASTEGIA